MTDWHSHVLPGIDDGSKDVQESISLLKALSEQGIHTVIATPHFYADECSVSRFLRRRDRALAKLEEMPEHLPRIICGAEVLYYPGISQLEGLKRLRVEGSDLLLLEMPIETWSEVTIREVMQIAGMSGVTVVLAHVERYLKYQSVGVWDRLLDSGVLMQINAGFLNSLRTRRKALSMLEDGMVQFVGSDCHNMHARPPRIGQAYERISKKLGSGFLRSLNQQGETLLYKKVHTP